MRAGRRLKDRIALHLEDLNHHLAQGVFIFGHEDGFAYRSRRALSSH